MLNFDCDVAVIGAGISGLYLAHRLQELSPNQTVCLFERSNVVGGRALTVQLDIGHECVDLGAGRYNVDRHLYLHQLIEDLNIPCVPFDAEGAPFQNSLFEATRERFRILCQKLNCVLNSGEGKHLDGVSFLDGACRYLGKVGADFVVAASGYDSLSEPRLPFLSGIDILFNHPETSSLIRVGGGRWLRPAGGFQAIPHNLYSALPSSCSVDFNHTLKAVRSVSPDSFDGVRLDFETAAGQRRVRAKQVVYAGSVRDFLRVGGCHLSGALETKIVDVPLMKGYVEYDRSWWSSTNLVGCCFTNLSPFRKVYFSRTSPHLLIYADGRSALALRDLVGDQGRVLEELGVILRDAVPFGALGMDSCLPIPIRQGWKFWEHGISFWEGGLNFFPANFWSYSSNIHVCSDLFTEHVGWVEGGIVSAEAVVHKIICGLGRVGNNSASGMRPIEGPNSYGLVMGCD